jgi:acyl-coenzyme A synthetase/AMP-(fatty) acid ligase
MPSLAAGCHPSRSWLKKLSQSSSAQPDKEFILSGHTFAQVFEMAAWLKDFYSSAGCNEKTICLAAENKAIIAAALLASLDGGPVLLLPFAFSKSALQEMQQAGGFIFAISDVERDFPAETKVICPEPGQAGSLGNLLEINPHAELLRLFTGGSTGAPKSWSKTANNLFSEAFYLSEKHHITDNDLIVATVSPYHIYGLLYSVLAPLLSLATVMAGTPSFPGEISEAVQKHCATIFVSVPVHYRVLKGRPISNNSLRLAFSSAGMLAQTDNEEFCRQNDIPVIEVYGSTETGGIAARVRHHGEQAFFPFDTVEWNIRHETLYVRSDYIAPDTEKDENGFFVANDRVELTDDDKGFFLKGRTDTVTKVGGKRVDLEEVRDTIKKQPGVAECLVISMDDPGGREKIIAALVQGKRVNLKELRKNIAGQLEPYAQPRLIKKAAAFPLTANGKYDLAAIRQLFA